MYTRDAGIPHPPAAEAAGGGRGIRRIYGGEGGSAGGALKIASATVKREGDDPAPCLDSLPDPVAIFVLAGDLGGSSSSPGSSTPSDDGDDGDSGKVD